LSGSPSKKLQPNQLLACIWRSKVSYQYGHDLNNGDELINYFKIAKQSFCDFLFFIIVIGIFIVIRRPAIVSKTTIEPAPTFEITVKQICSSGLRSITFDG
jgi:hypothetical protein